MGSIENHRVIAGSAVFFIFLAFVIAKFLAQGPPPVSPQISPEPSPSSSPSSTPLPRQPTPTPYPVAQNAHQWGSVTVFNGLPSDSVRAIAQTPDGVMWFGTDNGLARFDGRRIQTVSVGSNGTDAVTALETLPTGQLLVGTSEGAWVQAGGRFEVVVNTKSEEISTIFCRAESLFGTEAGNVYRLTRTEKGELFASPLLTEPLRDEDGTPLMITSITELDGMVVAATSGRGAFVIKGGAAMEFRTSPRPVHVNSLAGGPGGSLWMGTSASKGASGVFSTIEAGRAEKIAAPTADIFALETNDGGLWAGTERYGLFHFANGKLKKSYTFANTSGGLRSDTIYALFTDREGVLWIGTNRGVSRFDRMGPYQETVSGSPNSNFIRILAMSDKLDGSRGDQIYAGSNKGLFLLNESGHWSEIPGLRNKVIYDLKFRGGGSMFAGTPEGLFDSSGRKLADGDVRGFATFKSADYAAFFGRGVIDVTVGTPRKTIFENPSVTSVYSSMGRLWIGTAGNGLFSFDGKGVKAEVSPDVLKSGAIWGMAHLSEGDETLYIAGQHGVFAVQGGMVETIIAADDVRDVLPVNGEIWAATTTQGILHARRDERFGWLVSSVGFEQGLPSDKVFSILPVPEGLLIATNRGVVTYCPGNIPPKIIPVRVLSQRVHDLSETAATIELEYPQNSLLVEFAGQSSRTFPEEFQYAYVLTDGRGHVIDSRVSNEGQYSTQNLPAGDYTIATTAFDRDLNASEPLAIRFSVGTTPFPWTATALGVLLALSLFGLAWAIVEHRRIRLRTDELTAARFDLANEAERERRRIARDLHDQTLADLRNLMINSDRLTGDGSFRSEIESVSTEIRRICEDLSPSVLENVGLVAALEFLLSRTVEHGRFKAGDSAEESIAFPLKVQLQIYRIAQEVLTNISKHSEANMVEMTVSTSETRSFLMSIRDDGELFQPAATNGNGRGVANIRSRASLIGAVVKWKPDREGWNVFTLKLESGSVADSAT
jgi:signal transduction histidine kinase/ligand-binding sensor domain-containing protein